MSVPTVGQVFNPFTGVFGNGLIQTFTVSGTWTVPAGVTTARVRLWGAGGANGGSGGGFSLRTIYGLIPGTVIPVSVAPSPGITNSGTTSSFGVYASATGGAANSSANPGIGIGGDVNTSGGLGGQTANGGGGGAGNLFGNGGNGAQSAASGGAGASGGGGGNAATASGGSGAFSTGGSGVFTNGSPVPPTTGMQGMFSIDLIGVGGGGGANVQDGVNGGGGAYTKGGGFPGGGGGGGAGASSRGTAGLVIVEW